MARSQERPDREGVADAVGKVESAELEVGGCHVLQFEELKLVPAQVGCARRMIHDLREQQIGEVLDDEAVSYTHLDVYKRQRLAWGIKPRLPRTTNLAPGDGQCAGRVRLPIIGRGAAQLYLSLIHI